MTTQEVPLLKILRSSPQLYLKKLLALYGPPTQVFHINPEERTELIGAKGTRLTIPPFSIAGLSGEPVSGSVEIRLKETFSLAEMVMVGRPTTSEDRLLESAGQVMVQATGGDGLPPLRLAQPVTVNLPLNKKVRHPMAMRLFLGGASTFQPYAFGSTFDWGMASGKAVRICKRAGQKYYQFQLRDFNWAGCDFFVERRASRCMVTARPASKGVEFDSLLGYLAFKGIHTVARMYPGKNNCTAVNIPEKLCATAHLIGIADEQLYYGRNTLRRAAEKLVDVKMQAVSVQELVGALQKI